MHAPLSEATLSPVDRRRNLVAVTAAMTATSLIYGLSVPLLSLILEDRGFDGTLIGSQLGGLAYAHLPPHGIPLAIAALSAVLLPLPVAAWLRRCAC